MILMSLILAVSPSLTAKLRSTRLRSMGVTVVTTSAAYMLRLMYWRLSSCSALSAMALSKGRPSAKPMSLSALISTSLSNSLVPVKVTDATVGRSATTTMRIFPLTSIRTSLKSPSANKDRMELEALSSEYVSPTRTGKEANTVPASTRCKPSTRISSITKGVSARATWANKARDSAARRRIICMKAWGIVISMWARRNQEAPAGSLSRNAPGAIITGSCKGLMPAGWRHRPAPRRAPAGRWPASPPRSWVGAAGSGPRLLH